MFMLTEMLRGAVFAMKAGAGEPTVSDIWVARTEHLVFMDHKQGKLWQEFWLYVTPNTVRIQVHDLNMIRDNHYCTPRKSAKNTKTHETRRKSALSHCTLKL